MTHDMFFSTISLTSYLTSNKFLLYVYTYIYMFTRAKPHINGMGTGGRKKVENRF